MNKIILRFYILSIDDFIEVSLDQRLSFIENFDLLKEYINVDIKYILDYSTHIPLMLNMPIKGFNLPQYTRLIIL